MYCSLFYNHWFKLFFQCAEPKRWKAFDGRTTEMDTQFTLRARELLGIYRSISMKDLPQDERLDVLLALKHTVKVCFSKALKTHTH